MYFVYEVLLYLVFAATLPWFAVKGVLRGKYLSNFGERFGRYQARRLEHDLWIHAVSVGEISVARAILTRLQQRRPEISVIVTTTTLTGHALARKLMGEVTLAWFPFDFSHAVRRFLDYASPRACCIVETEIWPNVLRLARQRGIPIVLANARLSDRSFPRYRVVRPAVRALLRTFIRILAREETDRVRFLALGAEQHQVEVAGNIKFDIEVAPLSALIKQRVVDLATGRPVVVFGSVLEGEDELLLPLFADLIARGCFVILAPRKPERFELAAAMLLSSDFHFVQRSAMSDWNGPADVLLLDSIGELAGIYECATVAFVGGSLVAKGGHNPIEPAMAGVPVLFGPSMSNFREIATAFIKAGAAIQVHDASELRDRMLALLSDRDEREQRATAGRAVIDKNRGAADRTAARILEQLDAKNS